MERSVDDRTFSVWVELYQQGMFDDALFMEWLNKQPDSGVFGVSPWSTNSASRVLQVVQGKYFPAFVCEA